MFPCIRLCRKWKDKVTILFFYNDNQIKLDKKVSVKAQNATIEQVLAQMFKNSGYTYKIVNNQIIVSKANAVAAVEKQQQQQAKKVTGCVKDALGELSSVLL